MNIALVNYIENLQKEKLLREKRFPLKLLLLLYSKNKRVFYINYFENFKLFINWIGPVEIPAMKQYPRFQSLLYNYEQQEIAKHLGCDPLIIQQTILELTQNDSRYCN